MNLSISFVNTYDLFSGVFVSMEASYSIVADYAVQCLIIFGKNILISRCNFIINIRNFLLSSLMQIGLFIIIISYTCLVGQIIYVSIPEIIYILYRF